MLKVVQAQVVQVSVSCDVDTQQTRIDHGLEVVRHTRFRSSQAKRTAGKIRFSGKHTHERQAHRVTEGLKDLGQFQVLNARMGYNLHFDIVAGLAYSRHSSSIFVELNGGTQP